VTLFQPVIYN